MLVAPFCTDKMTPASHTSIGGFPAKTGRLPWKISSLPSLLRAFLSLISPPLAWRVAPTSPLAAFTYFCMLLHAFGDCGPSEGWDAASSSQTVPRLSHDLAFLTRILVCPTRFSHVFRAAFCSGPRFCLQQAPLGCLCTYITGTPPSRYFSSTYSKPYDRLIQPEFIRIDIVSFQTR